MERIIKLEVTPGIYWVAVPEADLYILCGCPEDSVKHLIQRGLIMPVEKEGCRFETGPNAILLSDLMLQNGRFSNLAEFPVLQMLYRQGMIIPNHPNNRGVKPLLIGAEKQISAQLEYIYRGNYGLVSEQELLDAGADQDLAKMVMRMKLRFAFGALRKTGELLDGLVVKESLVEIRNDVFIKRLRTNVFEIEYQGESVSVDLNLRPFQTYRSPYPLGFQKIEREYFAVIHSGQGDGWDSNRPSMSSILMYQGDVYLIDAGPNMAYALMALGIGVNEVKGIFHTHCHDDHFAGLTTLVRSDHKVKYFATPLVRTSVFKKLAALLNTDEEDFYTYFDVHDLELGVWNNINGLEVRPVLSPHPVETTVMFFRTFWDGAYLTYAHLADIISLQVLEGMIAKEPTEPGVTREFFETVKEECLHPVALKKIDIGAGMIHGTTEDFKEDPSDRIILAHTAVPLTTRQKEIGSSAPFGTVDVLVPDYSNTIRSIASNFLRAYFDKVPVHNLTKLLNNRIVEYNPGSIILRRGEVNKDIFLLLSGNAEMINEEEGIYSILSAGGLIGEYSGLHGFRTNATYRSISYIQALLLPVGSYAQFVKENRMYRQIERLHENRQFLQKTWLFGESISPPVQGTIAEKMELSNYYHSGEPLEKIDPSAIYLIKNGALARTAAGRIRETLRSGDFFGEESAFFNEKTDDRMVVAEPASVYEVPFAVLKDIPVVLWKLLETYERRKKIV
ncbi:MAG: cyclic nucleotide-binding domain-containing protein [Desulfobacterales bacterium]|nr:cyclic nucleotide-binding domain-containing protein [Desulfobacterales bacterium]